MIFFRHSKSISIKLWASVTILILVILGGLSLTISLLFADFYLDQKLSELSYEAQEISSQLSIEADMSTRIKLMDNINLPPEYQIVILNKKNSIVAVKGELSYQTLQSNEIGNGSNNSSGSVGFYMAGLGWFDGFVYPSDFLTEEDVKDVMKGRIVTIEAVPKNINGHAMLVAAVPLGSPTDSVLVLGSSPAPVQASIDAFKRIILYASFIAIILATIVSLIFARQVTRPLELMQKGASRMAQGDFQPIIGVNSMDELGQLANALNSMGRSLSNYVQWLSDERNLLEGIVEGISEAVIMIDNKGEVLYTNESATVLWDGGSEDSLEERKKRILAFIWQLAYSTEKQTTDYLTLGTQVLQISVTPTQISETTRGTVAVLRDVTASLRAEKERRDFMASVSHELRTPLHLIHGYLEAIQDGVIPKEAQSEHIELVLDEARRLAKLVNELQEFSQLEHWQRLDKDEIDIESFMQELKNRFQCRAEELGIVLNISTGKGTIKADRDRLLQVFINLIDNALRYTPKGKEVRLKFEKYEEKVIFIVEDQGEGIPQEAIPQIFERFYRVDKARSRKDGGMGLGLAIAKQIVVAHGGTIKVESKVGEGTRFTIELPA